MLTRHSVGNFRGNELKRNSPGNTRPDVPAHCTTVDRSCHTVELVRASWSPLSKKKRRKKAQTGEWICEPDTPSPRSEEKSHYQFVTCCVVSVFIVRMELVEYDRCNHLFPGLKTRLLWQRRPASQRSLETFRCLSATVMCVFESVVRKLFSPTRPPFYPPTPTANPSSNEDESVKSWYRSIHCANAETQCTPLRYMTGSVPPFFEIPHKKVMPKT